MNNTTRNESTGFLDNPEQLVAAALNEHGFMLQQVIRRKLDGSIKDTKDEWKDQWRFVATEYPVTAADGSQTRIDLLLRHCYGRSVHICLECKRPNPRFKKWIFFDRESAVAGTDDWQIYVETLHVGSQPNSPPDVRHNLERLTNKRQVPTFNYYIEAAIKRDGSASNNEAIEKAFCQVIKGQSGLMNKFERAQSAGMFRCIPVVVTTADLLEAEFDPTLVSVETGMIEAKALNLVSMDYCAVNYHADDSLALPLPSPHERAPGVNDLINAQIRTVFVVKATALNTFLNWANFNLMD